MNKILLSIIAATLLLSGCTNDADVTSRNMKSIAAWPSDGERKMAKKFFCDAGYGSSVERKEFDEHDYDRMIEWVRKMKDRDNNPRVIFGDMLEFEPREIVKSWSVKGWD